MKHLMTTLLLISLTAPAWGSHAMTQAEFRQVLHERDVAFARGWNRAVREQDLAERREQAALDQRNKVDTDYDQAGRLLDEKPASPAMQVMLAHLRAGLAPDQCAASESFLRAWTRRAWAFHRLNQKEKAALAPK